ncbi:cell wall-binding repeat-containing protein [Metaclostridioides mangenotii]|uniref:cell wall-binding repeat-containing protein n=1 Tax=Metaclostridioides mangenotii TaxID=1540 RepID=UPI000463210A|nr:cell wall-binding repeat-containing protein [Clostridioides mangenotii]
MKFKLLSKIGICFCVMSLLPVGTAFATDDLVKRQSNSDVGIRFEDSGNSGGGGVNPEPKAASVVLASGEKYTDILTSAVLANEKNASILLTQINNIGLTTLEEIDRLKVKDIIIVGGEDSVSKNVEILINNYGKKTKSSYKITRLAGSDRYETAVKVGNEVRKITKRLEDSVLVDGTNFSDIITISSYAAQRRIPILLTEPKK